MSDPAANSGCDAEYCTCGPEAKRLKRLLIEVEGHRDYWHGLLIKERIDNANEVERLQEVLSEPRPEDKAEIERLREENETWRKQYAIAIEKDERADRIEEAARRCVPAKESIWDTKVIRVLRAALEGSSDA